MKRRDFLAVTTALALPTKPLAAVGNSDVLRLRAGLDSLAEVDDRDGGHGGLEQAAVAGAQRTLEMQKGRASERVHNQLSAVASEYYATAAFASIDAFALDRARANLDRAVALAALSRDPMAQLRAYNLMAMFACQTGSPADAIAAARAASATRITRQDPLTGSLAFARTAIAYSVGRDRQLALRNLGYAREALSRAETYPRPGWLAFYGEAEIRTIGAIVHQNLGKNAEAESHWHQSLSAAPDQFRRNKVQSYASLALTQVRQGDVEQSCATAHQTLDLLNGDPLPGRSRTILGDIHRTLLTIAPTVPAAVEWAERARKEWTRA